MRRIPLLALALALACVTSTARAGTVIYDGTCPGANTTPGAAGSTTGLADVASVGTAGGWVDQDGVFNVHSARFATTYSGATPVAHWAYNTANAPPSASQSATIYMVTGGAIAQVHLRHNVSTKTGILLQMQSNQCQVITSFLAINGTYATGATGPIKAKVKASGTNPTTITLDVTDGTGASLFSGSATDSGAVYQVNGPVAFSYGPNDAQGVKDLATRIQIADESGATPLTGVASLSTSSPSGPTLAVTPAGGTAPYSCQLQRSSVQGSGYTNLGSPVSTSTTATLQDTAAPAFGTIGFYRWVVTSADVQTLSTTEVPASRWLTPIAIVDIGDSTMGVGTDDVATLTYSGTITGGAITLGYAGVGTTGAISGLPASAAALQSILDAAYGAGVFKAASSSSTVFTVTANGRYRFLPQTPGVATNTLVGGTVALAHTTTGAPPTTSTVTGIKQSLMGQLLAPRQIYYFWQAVPGATAAMFAPPSGIYYTSYLDARNAAVALVGASNVLVSHRFGINDAGVADPSASLAATDAITADCRSASIKVCLHDTSYSVTPPRAAFHDAYVPGLDARCDGVWIFKGQRAAFLVFANHAADVTWLADGTHYGANGAAEMAQQMASAEAANVFGVAGIGGGTPFRVRRPQAHRPPQASPPNPNQLVSLKRRKAA